MQNYYLARQRFTGVEVLDILFAFEEADRVLEELTDPEELLLFTRVTSKYDENAFYFYELNRVVILAPFIYPKLADGNTLNKPYNLFVTLAHEIFHSVINKTWAERSDSFKDEMECYYDHFNETCEIFGEKSCKSGPQTFQEDGPDIEGLRVAYDFFLQNYDEEELKEEIFKSDSFSVDRQQSFFYLNTLFYCAKIVNIFFFFLINNLTFRILMRITMMCIPIIKCVLTEISLKCPSSRKHFHALLNSECSPQNMGDLSENRLLGRYMQSLRSGLQMTAKQENTNQ
ncbi:hypothetical protein PRIPAC_97803 [Pristionchus pacificus]|uniref:Peptidase n=1 Tax=Pristionchus pacificus TaxID=54126 RepID=A0A2A6BC81_PRIPA|nr:hypothetical protein PRIPAC_97803 [Pristionchus pacificus]|eukprot:PDM63477.1 Peptidase [Pristionchus pacificus]